MTDRKRLTAGFWITVDLVAVLVCSGLFWAVCWMVGRDILPWQTPAPFCRPAICLVVESPQPIASAGQQFIGWNKGACFGFPENGSVLRSLPVADHYR